MRGCGWHPNGLDSVSRFLNYARVDRWIRCLRHGLLRLGVRLSATDRPVR